MKSKATCTRAEIYYKSCKTCGQKSSSTFTYGKAKGHSYTKTAKAKFLKSKATCSKKAVYYKSCDGCGKKSTSTFTTGDTLPHKTKTTVAKKATTYYLRVRTYKTVAGKKFYSN